MSYLKLCQIISQTAKPEFILSYLEDCDKNILLANQTYPLVLQCEVIDWVSEEEFNKRGKLNPDNTQAFQSVQITLNESPQTSIRQAVFAQLQSQFPNLVI